MTEWAVLQFSFYLLMKLKKKLFDDLKVTSSMQSWVNVISAYLSLPLFTVAILSLSLFYNYVNITNNQGSGVWRRLFRSRLPLFKNLY